MDWLNSYPNTYADVEQAETTPKFWGKGWNRRALTFYQHQNARRIHLPVLEFDAPLQHSHQSTRDTP